MKGLMKFLTVLIIIISIVSCELIPNEHQHDFSEGQIIKNATCSESGEILYTCSCLMTKSEIITPLGHVFGEWVIEKEATYSDSGIKHRICTCGAKERVVVDKLMPVFEENFDGAELNRKNWSLCPEWIRHDGGSIWNNKMTSLDGEGHLVLRAEWDDANGRVKCGAIRSKGLFEYGYGYYEASIKFPVAPGIWGAFWINCGNIQLVDGSAADGVEIDVIESIYNEKGYFNAALHWDGYDSAHKSVNTGHLSDCDIYDGNFHLFAVERNERGYIFYIDGIVIWRVYSYSCAPCPELGFLELSLEGTYEVGAGTEASLKALPAEMLVDYVKVYEKNPYK